MAENVGWATLDIIPSAKGLAANLERQTKGDMAKAGRTAGREYGDAAGREAGGRLRSLLQSAAAPLGGVLAGAGLVAGLKSIATAASEAEQSVGGVQAVFGEYADQVLRDSDRAAQGLGLSANAYRELVTVSSALLKNKGLEDFAEQGRNLVQIGADLAAQFGGSTQQAVEALNAAMRGESDPIERYAVSLNETAVNAELARTGMAGLEGAALEQAKAQARLSLITQQTADAQGAFAREADTAAGASQRLSAALQDRLAKAGTVTLGAVTALANGLNQQVLPALDGAAGVAADAVRSFRDLPGPVQAATGALAAFAVARRAGLTGAGAGAARSGLSRMQSGMDTLRLRTMLAADEYRRLRGAQLTFINGAPRFDAATGRLTASLGALRTGAAGAGAALRRGLGGAMSLLGGPWGIALAGGAALLTKFWSEHREAKAHVDALTQSLDEQTGAITDNTREKIRARLEEEGLLKLADELGISLSTVQKAAEGNTGALRNLRDEQERVRASASRYLDQTGVLVGADNERFQAVGRLIAAVTGESEALDKSRAEWDRRNRAVGANTSAQEKVTRGIEDYKGELDKARAALQRLLDKENERRGVNLSAFDSQTRLAAAFRDAREEAAEGARTLNENTEAGEANRDALSALAAEWNNAPDKIQRAKGAYETMRQQFIDVAEEMGAGKEQARRFAEQLLEVPKNVAPKFSTPGMDAARERIRRLEAQIRNLHDLTTLRFTVIGPSGEEFGRGLGVRPHVPARGVPSGPRSQPRVQTPPMFDFRGSTIEAHDYGDFVNQMQRRSRARALDGWGG